MDQPQFPGMNPNGGNTASVVQVQQKLVQRTFSWMFAGLLLSALVAFFVNDGVAYAIATNRGLFLGLGLVQLALVWGLGGLFRRISPTTATVMFFAYAAIEGLFFSVVFNFLRADTVVASFLIAAGMFGMFAVYGYVTKRDLSRIGSIVIMGILGLFLVSVVNIFFLHSNLMSLLLSFAVIVLFCVATAFDIQQIKYLSQQAMDENTATKFAIYGALMLYIDFLGILWNLLNILSRD